LRKAELPEKVISVTDDVSVCEIPNKHALSALWTTRGGAFRDLNDLAAAERAAADAIRESPTSYHPHNLLGAVMYEMGRPAEGDEHFAEATRLGSAPRNQDSEIRQALRRSSPEARRKVVEYLLAKDPAKYSWARRFAE
jgi:tetratricopeptide (TPR) repeat protein